MSDPNARRDKALEGIARSLDEIAGLLKKIEQNTRRVTITNYPDATERPDPFNVPQLPQPGEAAQARGQQPEDAFVTSSHPYLRRSLPDASSTAESAGGPYGTGDETNA